MNGTPCMICRQKTDTLKLLKLQRLYNQLRSLNVDESQSSYQFSWNNYSRCRYGLSCNELRQYDQKCNSICRQLNPYIEAVASDPDNKRDYITILDCCRGDYPQVYHEVERLRASINR